MFGLSQVKLIIGGIILVIIIGLIITVYFERAEVKNLEADLKQSQVDLKVCGSANKDSQLSIVSLQRELQSSSSTCQKRLDEKDKLCQTLTDIDNLPTKESKDEKIVGGDAVYAALNGMFSPNTAGGKN